MNKGKSKETKRGSDVTEPLVSGSSMPKAIRTFKLKGSFLQEYAANGMTEMAYQELNWPVKLPDRNKARIGNINSLYHPSCAMLKALKNPVKLY